MGIFELAARPYSAAIAFLGTFFQEFWTLRAPLFWAIVISIGILVPAQVRELYLINAEQVVEQPGYGKFFTFAAVFEFYFQLLSVAFLVFWLRIVCYQILNRGMSQDWRHFFSWSERDATHPNWLSLVICTLPQIALFWRTIGNAMSADELPEIRNAFWVLTVIQAVFVLFSFGFLAGWTQGPVKSLLGRIGAALTRIFERLNALTPFDLYGTGGVIVAVTVYLLASGFAPFGGLVFMLGLLVLFNLPFQPVTFWIFAAFLLFAVIAIALNPVGLGPELGPIALLSLFACCLVLVTSVLGLIEDRFHFPASPLVVGAALLFSWRDWNDNHHLHMTANVTPNDIEAAFSGDKTTDLQRAFQAWLVCRPGYAQSIAAGRRYPVYLVAAQGGGLYAAYQSAVFLAEIQDRGPQFRDHVFAASGVSGGSVGVTIFSALTALQGQYPANSPCDVPVAEPARAYDKATLAKTVNETLQHDFLSPVGAALLFPDMLARLSPWPIRSADRTFAIEQSFEQNFFDATHSHMLTEPLLGLWDPASSVPALFLNTIDVDTGRRMVLSPFLDLGDVISFRDATDCQLNAASCQSPTLASGMLLSARFPLVTPAGTLMLPQKSETSHPSYSADPASGLVKARFVDGGYFENSGLDTVADLIEEISQAGLADKVVFRVLTFDFPLSLENPPRRYWLGEIASPIRALNSARSARIDPARNRIDAMDNLPSVKLISVSLDDRQTEFPLGWTLSKHTFDRIACDLFDEIACGRIGRDLYSGTTTLDFSIAKQNRDRLRLIVDEVSNPASWTEEQLQAPTDSRATAKSGS